MGQRRFGNYLPCFPFCSPVASCSTVVQNLDDFEGLSPRSMTCVMNACITDGMEFLVRMSGVFNGTFPSCRTVSLNRFVFEETLILSSFLLISLNIYSLWAVK